jgi:uncharacterized protein (TIGR02246 family)
MPLSLRIVLFLSVQFLGSTLVGAAPAAGDSDVRNVVSKYEHALNAQKVDDLVALFADTGVAQIQGSASSVGQEKVREFFGTLFRNLKFDLVFEIEEVLPISGDWVLIRTTSHGFVRIGGSGANVSSTGQEMFLLRKQNDDTWKIARYAASATK